ncbi:MAG: pyrroline-5-carboxylate reductase [Phycisphaeraceae bacterium]
MGYRLAFIGAGNMAEAIARAALGRGVVQAEQVIAADPSEDRRALFAAMGVAVTDDNAAAVSQSEQVVLAVKPQTLPKVAQTLGAALTAEHVVISIMAGVRLAKLGEALGGHVQRLVRVMPNTPMLVGRGMSAIALGPGAREGDDELAMQVLSAGGEAVRVDESAMDAVTAVSGSGPAYVFYLAEAMERAARELGLGEHARTLVAQTLVGAAHLLAESEHEAAELRRRVASPGGTTEAALKYLDGADVSDAIVGAIKAAAARSEELGA